MDIFNAIKLLTLFLVGLALVLFPKKVYKFQNYLVKKIYIEYNTERYRRYYANFGVILIIISIILFLFSIFKTPVLN